MTADVRHHLKSLSNESVVKPNEREQLLENLEGKVPVPQGAAGYWNDGNYLELWPFHQIHFLNDSYRIAELLPGFIAFGSNGRGDVLLVSSDPRDSSVYTAPFVGLGKVGAERAADHMAAFLESLGVPDPKRIVLDKPELVEIKPILFGGDPIDQSNKSWLSREEHIQFVNFWNQTLESINREIL